MSTGMRCVNAMGLDCGAAGLWKRCALLVVLALLASPVVLAANDPGHDTLYIEEIGNSSLTGSLNISSNLRVTNLFYSSYLDIQGNGSQPGNAHGEIYATSANALHINAPGNLYLLAGTGSMVYVGTSNVDLNVSRNVYVTGAITQGGIGVCLANGTNCPVIGGSSSAGGWTNDSTATRTQLYVVVNSSTSTGSFIVQNTSGSNHFFVNGSSGRVGVGTIAPQRALEISGTDSAELTTLRLSNTAWVSGQLNTLEFYSGTPTGSNLITSAIKSKLYGGGANGELQFWTNNENTLTQQMVILNNGAVGIGTATPTQNLTVNGTANITGAMYLGNSKCSGAQVLTTDSATGLISCTTPSAGGSGGGWVNDSVTTRTTLQTIVNSSNMTGSFIVQNTSGSPHLFVNGTRGHVGVGTSTPAYTLDVNGEVNSNTYYVGGVTYLSSNTLHIYNNGANGIIYANGGASSGTTGTIIGGGSTDAGLILKSTYGIGTSDYIQLIVGDNGNTEAMRIVSSGQVGIGTLTPITRLESATEDNAISNTTTVLALTHTISNASNGTAGTGVGIVFRTEDSVNQTENISMIIGNLTVATNGSENGDLQFLTRNASGLYERMRVKGNGDVNITTGSMYLTGSLVFSGAGGGGAASSNSWANLTTANQTITGTTLANITGLEWVAIANKRYAFTCNIYYSSNATTNGISFSVEDWEATISYGTFAASIFGVSATTANSATARATGAKMTSTDVAAVDTIYVAMFTGTVVNGASNAIITPQFSAEVAGQDATIVRDSTCTVREI